MPALTPSHWMIPLKCLPRLSAGHERRVCPHSQHISVDINLHTKPAPQHSHTVTQSAAAAWTLVELTLGLTRPPGVASSSSMAFPQVTPGQVTPVTRGNASSASSFHHSSPQSGTVINFITTNPNPRATPVIRANTAALPVTQAHLARCHHSPGATHHS